MPRWLPRLASLLALAVGYLACVLGGAREMPMAGPAVVGVILVVQSLRWSRPLQQVGFVATIAVLGTLTESLLLAVGVYVVDPPRSAAVLCPLWVTCQWLNVALAVPDGLAPLARRLPLAAAVALVTAGAAAGLADWLGAVHIPRPLPVRVAAIAAMWAIAFPAMLWFYRNGPYRLEDEGQAAADT